VKRVFNIPGALCPPIRNQFPPTDNHVSFCGEHPKFVKRVDTRLFQDHSFGRAMREPQLCISLLMASVLCGCGLAPRDERWVFDALVLATTEYVAQYGSPPFARRNAQVDQTFRATWSSSLVATLEGRNPTENAKSIAFLGAGRPKCLDPATSNIYVTIDSDNDGWVRRGDGVVVRGSFSFFVDALQKLGKPENWKEEAEGVSNMELNQ
jgi:hypothetical protein